LIAVLTVLIILYVTNGAKNTYNSPFYTRTVQAIKDRQETEARENVIAEERARTERVERLQREHDAAVSAAAATATSVGGGDAAKAAGVGAGAEKQKPLAHDVEEAAADLADKVKPVAGRKTMTEKIVQTKPDSAAGDDGVAKVGNVEAKASSALTGEQEDDETEEDRRVETELNDILKKGPIIIFSKSYCPFSKKAKHILLDLYTITPPPYVVELDQHELGPGLQGALQKMTGRRTVPNVLINGKSIGGGDDVEALHTEGKIVETVKSMGGKRVVSVVQNEVPEEQDEAAKKEVKFKA
jgi:glutaredoxin